MELDVSDRGSIGRAAEMIAEASKDSIQVIERYFETRNKPVKREQPKLSPSANTSDLGQQPPPNN
jgi:hypothetical protein